MGQMLTSARAMRDAEQHLSQSCQIMARLIVQHGPCPLADREFRPFQTLANSIISQQLSAKAADTIERARFYAFWFFGGSYRGASRRRAIVG